jgi:hypothetical protein
MKKTIFTILVLFLLTTVMVSGEEDITQDEFLDEESKDLYEEEYETIAEEDIYDNIGDVELEGSAGITPDSPLYILESILENILLSNDPETALKYKEEKVHEIKAMIEAGDEKAARKALKRLDKYNDVLEKEVSPDLDEKVRRSSKATKALLESLDIEGEEWAQIREIIKEDIKKEDKIALAAKISKRIKELCETLSDLDPLEYSNVCKTGEDAPKWKKDLDRKLTKEQEIEAKEFFNIMSECFDNPSECRCNDISVQPFAEQCNIIAPLAAKCEAGDEQACEDMEKVEDPIDLLPDYLQNVMMKVEDRYGDAKHDLHIPKECVKEGALTKDACMKVMFRLNAPEECLEALENGKIDPKNEKEAREACEEIMFDLEAPEACKEAGLKDHRECDRLMFKLDAPEECLDAGLDGSGRDDWKKCEIIRFKLDAPQECLDAGITGEKRDDWKKCEAINFKLDSPQECLDAGLDGTGRDDWKKCDAIRFKLDAPQECLDKGLDGTGRDDWRKCEAIKFKLEAHPDCLAAGLDGTGRDDWRKCQKIQFKAEAPDECLDAGLDGSGRDDWRECDKIREKTEDKGERREDCGPNELHICENGYCKCVYEEKQDDGPYEDNGGSYEESECKDGCSDECPGADRTDCVNDKCECYYDDNSNDGNPGGDDEPSEPEQVPDEEPEPEPEPEPEEEPEPESEPEEEVTE